MLDAAPLWPGGRRLITEGKRLCSIVSLAIHRCCSSAHHHLLAAGGGGACFPPPFFCCCCGGDPFFPPAITFVTSVRRAPATKSTAVIVPAPPPPPPPPVYSVLQVESRAAQQRSAYTNQQARRRGICPKNPDMSFQPSCEGNGAARAPGPCDDVPVDSGVREKPLQLLVRGRREVPGALRAALVDIFCEHLRAKCRKQGESLRRDGVARRTAQCAPHLLVRAVL